jgi:pyruvate kinase
VNLPLHRTKIVAAIGPASASPAVLEAMIRAGLEVARGSIAGDSAGSQRMEIIPV